jgi:hypothetical protein
LFRDSNKEDPVFVLDCSGKFYEETENKSVPLAFSFTDSEQASIISSSLLQTSSCDRVLTLELQEEDFWFDDEDYASNL